MSELPDDEVLELHELCQALLDGRIDAGQSARLSALLDASEEARRYYVRTAALGASLHQYASEMQTEAPVLRIVPRPRLAPAARWALGSLAAAAAFTLGLWFAHSFREPREPGSTHTDLVIDSEETVARIVGLKDCQWTTHPHQPGDELRAGERLEVASGFAEVSFDSGAQVTLEGPASFEVASAWEASLLHGALRANVPPESAGFRVVNASVEVVDLGTEFSMLAEEAGDTEVFVLKGAVEATPTSGHAEGKLLLREKESRRFAAGGSGEVRDRDRKFARFLRRVALDRVVAPAHYVHWSFDEAAGGAFASQAVGVPAAELKSDSPTAPPLIPDGRWHSALHLSNGYRLKGEISSWPESRARTIAFWLRVPAEEPVADGEPFLTWQRLALRWNHDPARGALGALQTELGRGYRTGSTELRDGRWHHLAVAYSSGAKPGKYQLKQYVDARLQPTSAKRALKYKPVEPVAEAGDLIVGSSSPGFRADLDELFIADRVLSPKEIQGLMLQNTLPSGEARPETVASNAARE